MEFDLLVVGGGVNGAGVARDAAGRGLSVLLVEQNDLASATSSASTKLVHGGLRYLEYYKFRLVREALEERETLLAMAPHIIWPLQFILPHANATRPAWMIRLGLFLYDHIGGRRRLPGSRGLSLKGAPQGAALRPEYRRAFAYSDCWVDDARLVTLNAMDARERGAVIETRTKLVSARRVGASWEARLQPVDGPERQVRARAIVNAAGPWVSDLLGGALNVTTGSGTRLVKGSHIVVPRLFEGDHAYMLQNPDRRIVFAIPYEDRFTLVGTTDLAWDAPPGPAQISSQEVDYLCESINRYFVPQITADDVVWSYAGLRPLFDDNANSASAVTRDYVLEVDAPEGEAPVLSVFGGKITTYRRLAGQAMDRLAKFFPRRASPGRAAPCCRAVICPTWTARPWPAPSAPSFRFFPRSWPRAWRGPTERARGASWQTPAVWRTWERTSARDSMPPRSTTSSPRSGRAPPRISSIVAASSACICRLTAPTAWTPI